MLKRTISITLIALHLLTFGPLREALAFSSQSSSYKLTTADTTQGGGSGAGQSARLVQATIGEPCAGGRTSSNYILYSGFTATLGPSSPILVQDIPGQLWKLNDTKINVFDLDDYFQSPDGYELTYSVSGNSQIEVLIDPATHQVNLSQPQGWQGKEEVRFTATDTEGGSTQSNYLTLRVETGPVIESVEVEPANILKNALIKLSVKARILNDEPLSFSYSEFFKEGQPAWQDENEPGLWHSQATWQTNESSTGRYTIKVTVADTKGLTDSREVNLNVKDSNQKPVLEDIPQVNAKEGDLLVFTNRPDDFAAEENTVVVPLTISDPDEDALILYYYTPLDGTGKWLTDFADAGTHTARITLSDGIDTDVKEVSILVEDVNQPPQAQLELDKQTTFPGENILVSLSVTDPDKEEASLAYTLKKDSQVIASGNINNNQTLNFNTNFSDKGDHNISAEVTDRGGLVAVDTKGVQTDSVDESVTPLMGDFNGDSLTDLGIHNFAKGIWEVCLSDKGSFPNAVNWLSNFGTSRDELTMGGDFNGDGKSDVGLYNWTNGQFQVAISTGSSFATGGTWFTFSEASASWQPTTGNFNGDRYTDFAIYNKDTGEVRVALGTGSGFGPFTTWLNSGNKDYILLSGDFNGDSLGDICLFKKSSGEFRVVFSNTKAFVDEKSWITGFANDKDPLIADFNNDGLTDIGYWEQSSANWYYAISNGNEFTSKGVWLSGFGSSSDESGTTGDFNGDGITDAATFDKQKIGILRWTTRITTDKQPADLLTRIDNGIGGVTQATYTFIHPSPDNILPFPVYVANSIALVNTFPASRQASYTQQFNFYGGYFDAQEREFRGFQRVRVTDPITKNYTETYFFQGKPGQDAALKGQIEKVWAYDGNNRKISYVYNRYEVKKLGPDGRFLGFPSLVEQTTTVWEENNTYLTTRDNFVYDNLGNPIEQINQGDILKSGDERSTTIVYAAAYQAGFNRPIENALRDKDKNIVTQKKFEYDSRGNLTKEDAWLYNPLTKTENRAPTTYTYDSFGNLVTSTNAKGATVTTEYETDYYTYPKQITNALGHTVSYTYDPKLGTVTSVTDPNGQTSSTEYDSLGRTLSVTNALGQTVTTYEYPDFNTKITRQLNLTKTEYIDGLGRKYRSVSQGEDGDAARQVVSEVFYNSRGLVVAESLPHYDSEDPNKIYYTAYRYDLRGRILQTFQGRGLKTDLNVDEPLTYIDAKSSILYKSPLYAEAIDPRGNKKGALKDIFGNVIEVAEFTSQGVFKTVYEYDIQNNLIKLTDSQGNISQIFYDNIGRKLKMIDPDMGTWAYEYDILGNLVKQTDAKAQVLTFDYDALNRLTAKQGLSPQGTVPVLMANYLYDDASKDNCLGRLSKVIDQSGSTEFFYDKLGREIKSIKTVDSLQYAVEREYDLLDRLTKLTYPDEQVVNYSYDENSGLLEKVFSVDYGLSTIDYVKDITYNAKGQILNIKYANGTQTDYTYGTDLRLSHILTQGPTKTLQDLTYVFDNNGNIIKLTDNLRSRDKTSEFTYDDLDRLTEATNIADPVHPGDYITSTYRYDAIGNMLSKAEGGATIAMSYGEGPAAGGGIRRPHAVTLASGYRYQYDANGNMIVGKNKTMEYDVENRLIRLRGLSPQLVPEGEGTDPEETTFVYDGDGGRVIKTVHSPQSTVDSQTIYIGSLYEIKEGTVPEGGLSPTITKHIFAGANRIATISLSLGGEGQGEGAISYYHSDHLGSSNVITDQNGQQLARYEYAPYGTVSTSIENPASNIKHLFTGKELDSTGLYFYGARYYDPELGRFITADTIVQAPNDPQSLNRYSYCRNNPINYVDPSGHWWWFIALIIKFAVAHPIIAGAIAGATLNTVMNASNISNFGNFMAYAAIGAVSGAAGGGAGAGVGSAFGAFWGTVAGGLAGGFAGGFGNASYAGASFGQALAFGGISAVIAAGTSAVIYGGAKVAGKVIDAVQNASKTRAAASGTKTPIGQQGKGSATSSLNTNKGESASGSQALSSRGTEEVDRIVIRKHIEPRGHRYVGSGEAAEASNTGYVPNTTVKGDPKSIFYTPEEALTSASQAKSAYNLPNTPTHRLGLDTSQVTNTYGGNVEGGGGIEMTTNDKVPVIDIQKLGD